MNYTDMVKETWRHSEPGPPPHDYRELVRYATLAVSSHNTQPWIFKLETNRIQVLPDLSRRCPAVDPDDHHLHASLGCATDNLLQAAALDLRTAFINQPVEVATLRPEFASAIGIGNRRPDLVVRIGRGPQMPRSLRRQIEDVIRSG